MPFMIEAVGLSKSFGRVTALDDLDIALPSGQVAAVLGPNGAGKTTFLRAISTLVRPDHGRLAVCGVDVLKQPARVRQLIGLAGQHATVEEALTGRENLRMIAQLFGQDRSTATASATEVLARLGLEEVADRLVRTYSGGLRRRLDLGASLVGRPRVLLLDEPTTGLDPHSRLELWDSIRALTEEGTDVLLTTQYLEEADRLARTVVIIDHGRAIASGTVGELKSRFGHDVIEVRVRRVDDLAVVVGILTSVGAAEPHLDAAALAASVSVRNGSEALMQVARSLLDHRIDVEDLALRRPTLDEVFLALTGRSAGEGADADPGGGIDEQATLP